MATARVEPHHWTREEYERLVESGGMEDWKVELVDGALYDMTAQSSHHASALRKVHREIQGCLPKGLDVRQQMPLALSHDSEPEPDVAVVPADPNDYGNAHPASAALIVEVAHTSLHYDREIKGTLYARAGVPEYWILSLVSRQLEVYREPTADRYSSRTVLTVSDEVSPLFAPGASIPVRRLFPK